MKTISDHHLNKIWRWLSWTFIISYVCFFMYVLLVLGGGFNQKLVISEFKRSHNQKCLGSCNLNKAELLEKKPHRHVKNMQTAHRRRLSWIKLSCCEAAVKFKNNTFKKVFLGDFHFSARIRWNTSDKVISQQCVSEWTFYKVLQNQNEQCHSYL